MAKVHDVEITLQVVVENLSYDVAVSLLKKMFSIVCVIPNGTTKDEYMGHPHVTHGTYEGARESLISQGYERSSIANSEDESHYCGYPNGQYEEFAVIVAVNDIDPQTDAAKVEIYIYERSYEDE